MRARDVSGNQTPVGTNHKREGYYKHGGARGSDTTPDTGDSHRENKTP